MKKEQNILHDVIGTSPPEEASKTRKYIRIAFSSVLLSLLALVVVMAALRKCGA
jgi:hypothetical protein